MAQAACEWRRCIEEAENILRCLDRSQWVEVRYEDFCRDTEAIMGRLQQFLGVEPGKQHREFRAVGQHIVGNGMRLDTTSEIRLDARWREALTERDLRTFHDVAGDMNQRYGYQ